MVTASDPSRQTLSVVDAMITILGMVIGAGVFRTPSLVAASPSSLAQALPIWLCGGAIALIGALCYAELTPSCPHSEYHFMTRAVGPTPGFLFAWARITVIRTGSIAMLAFILGDYLSEILPLGTPSPFCCAGLSVAVLTLVNVLGIRYGKLNPPEP
jgi:amino acid transporter